MTTTTSKTRRRPAAPAADTTATTAPHPAFSVRVTVDDAARKALTFAVELRGDLDTQTACDEASEAHRTVRATAKVVAAFHKEQARPLTEALAAMRKVAAEDVAPWESADDKLAGAIAKFHVEQAQRAAAEASAAASAAEAEAEAVRVAMVANLNAAAENAASPEVAAALRAEADDTAHAPLDVAPVVPVAAPPPVKVAGQSVVTSYESVVVDRDEAIAAIALPLVVHRYLPLIIERYVEGMTAGKARLARAEILAAAAEVAATVAAPSPEVLTLDKSALDVVAKRQGAAMLYPGLTSRAKVGVRYRS
jgi:hypothetical protein